MIMLVSKIRSHKIQPADMLPKMRASFRMFAEGDVILGDVSVLGKCIMPVCFIVVRAVVASQLRLTVVSRLNSKWLYSYSPEESL